MILSNFISRTVEEYKKVHVDAPNIFNIAIRFNTPNGTHIVQLMDHFYDSVLKIINLVFVLYCKKSEKS